MDFDRWIDAAWNEHARDAAGVAARLETEGAALANDDAALGRLAHLAHHLHGDHLGSLAEGRALLARLAAHPAAGEATQAQLCLYDASLALTGGEAGPLAALPPSAGARVQALAAANLAERDAARAGALLAAAAATAAAAPADGAEALPDTDPAVRAVAVAGNNIAAALEERAARTPAETALMLQAARTGLVFWRRAGSWLQAERAHYRLAHSLLKAGEPAAARQEAQACLDLVAANGDEPLEAFFGWEALALAGAAAGDPAGHARALAQARAAFARLPADDQAWCRASLDKLALA